MEIWLRHAIGQIYYVKFLGNFIVDDYKDRPVSALTYNYGKWKKWNRRIVEAEVLNSAKQLN